MPAKSISIALERLRAKELATASKAETVWIPGVKDGENRAVRRKLKQEGTQLKRWCKAQGIINPTAKDVQRFKGDFLERTKRR
jgi:hypothetical protein